MDIDEENSHLSSIVNIDKSTLPMGAKDSTDDRSSPDDEDWDYHAKDEGLSGGDLSMQDYAAQSKEPILSESGFSSSADISDDGDIQWLPKLSQCFEENYKNDALFSSHVLYAMVY